ncbi:Dynein assembly factor 1, axonemal [Gonapodya sp. JEL0774]|nr:Dynein assembly factor 1, axonemal [Gonapodya sp. JEL0774]
MENLERLVNLDTLSLGNNLIHKIEGIGSIAGLKTLQMPNNYIRTAEDMKGLLECPSLSILDLSHNKIEDPTIIDVLVQMPNLTVLNLQGNPVIRQIENYRRRLIAGCKKLTYLDDRPVFESERKQVEAWARGGLDAEREERQKQREEERAEHQRNFEALLRIQREAVERRRARGEDVDSDPRYDSPQLRRLHADMLSQIENDNTTVGGDNDDSDEGEDAQDAASDTGGGGETHLRQGSGATDGEESDSGASTAAQSEGSRRSLTSARSGDTAVRTPSNVPVRRFREVDVTGRAVAGDADAENDTASEAGSERSGATVQEERAIGEASGRRVLIQEIGGEEAAVDSSESNHGDVHQEDEENRAAEVPPLEDASAVIEEMRMGGSSVGEEQEDAADRFAREIRAGPRQAWRGPIIEEL